MKKIFLLILVIASGFLLAACNKKEIEVTHQEAQQMLAAVNGEETLENTFGIKGNVSLVVDYSTNLGSYDIDSKTTITGSINGFADFSSYENHYLYLKFNLSMTSVQKTEGSEVKTTNKLSGKLYIVNGNTYIDMKTTTSGSEITVKSKQLQSFTEEKYNEFADQFKANPQIPESENSIEIIGPNTVFKMYQVGSKHQLHLNISQDKLNDMFNLFGQEIQVEFNEKNYLTLDVLFSERFESLKLRGNLDVKVSMGDVDFMKFGLKGKVSLDINTNVRRPSGLPSQETLDSYPESAGEDLFPSPF